MIKNCRIHWVSLLTGNSGVGNDLLTLEEAVRTLANLNVMYKNIMKHWFEFEDVTSNGEGSELADEQ